MTPPQPNAIQGRGGVIAIGVSGALGRMGSAIIDLALVSKDFKVRAVFERSTNRGIGKPFKEGLVLRKTDKASLAGVKVLIDFTEPSATLLNLNLAADAGCGMVIGTTGMGDADVKKIEKAAQSIPVVFSPNMSLGANLLFELAAEAARRLDDSYDIEIVEAHHRMKKDAPSGTAKRLAEKIAEAKGWKLDDVAVQGRSGITGQRPSKQIGIHSVRAGEIVGIHTAIFSGPGETIELKHEAQSRDAFARGALTAARFVSGKKAGLYTMRDVLQAVISRK